VLKGGEDSPREGSIPQETCHERSMSHLSKRGRINASRQEGLGFLRTQDHLPLYLQGGDHMIIGVARDGVPCPIGGCRGKNSRS